MPFMDHQPRAATLTIEPHPPATRLRFKGQLVRLTDYDGTTRDYRVTAVSMPDEWGRCQVTLEATEVPA